MRKYAGWIGAAILFLLSKAKWVFAILKIGKFSTLISMFISLGAYAVFFGWKFAIAIIYLIFIHEMGHLVAARIKNLKTSPAIFIPFLGAAIGLKEKPKDAKTEAFVAYGGPLAGLISIVPALLLYWTTGEPYWALVIQLGALINLFNLFPVSPLDGGRIVTVLSTKLWFVGLMVIFVFLFLSPDPILILIFIFGLFSWWGRVREGYELKKKDAEMRTLLEIRDEIVGIRNSLKAFDTEENATALYEKNSYMYELQAKLRAELPPETKKRFFFPYFQDEAKINQHVLGMKRKKTHILLSVLASEDVLERLDDMLHKIDEDKAVLQAEMNKLRKYYVADMKTKIVVLVCYLALALVLAILLMYGLNILESHPELRR